MARNITKGTADDLWRKLTWDDLSAWAGSTTVERGRRYQRSDRVSELRRDGDGLLAWVLGTERYATEVTLAAGPAGEAHLQSRCTCPVGVACKHAVAAAIEYLENLKKKKSVPAADEEDPRRELLAEVETYDEEDMTEDEWDDYGDDEGYDDEEDEAPPPRAVVKKPPAASPQPLGKKAAKLRPYLEALPPASLVDLVLKFADRHREILQELSDSAALVTGKTAELIKQTRREIQRVTAQEIYYNHWSGEGNLPDYGGIRTRLEQLRAAGEADAILNLGRELFEPALSQTEQIDDEGETIEEIASCMDVVFAAVGQSSRPNSEKLLYVIDLMLDDDFDATRGAGAVLDAEWPRSDWSAVADVLLGRLQETPRGKSDESYLRDYQRDRLSGWAVEALERAGRGDEILAIYEAEASATGSYERLVRHLIGLKRLDDAERWIREGIAKTAEPFAGIAKALRDRWREIGVARKDHTLVAALDAEEFFEYPTVSALRKLEASADKAGCGEQVRAAARRFLETGKRPAAPPAPAAAPPRKGRRPAAVPAPDPSAEWPLPGVLPPKAPEAKESKSKRAAWPERKPEPYYHVLLDLALAEKRPDDVLKWYDAMAANRHSDYAGDYRRRVADAVADAHPERSLEIYRKGAEGLIDRTSPAAYEEALGPLRKMRALLEKLGRGAEWAAYLKKLRADHARKRRLMEALGRLDEKPIVEG